MGFMKRRVYIIDETLKIQSREKNVKSPQMLYYGILYITELGMFDCPKRTDSESDHQNRLSLTLGTEESIKKIV